MGTMVFVPRKESVASDIRTKIPLASTGSANRVDVLLDLQEAAYVVPYFMASGGVIGRGAVGPGFDVVPSGLSEQANEVKRRAILNFFNYAPSAITNIKDVFSARSKLYTTAFMFRLFGQAAWQIVYNEGRPVGFDLIPGVVLPNIEHDGKFKKPAYIQYLRSSTVTTKTEFNDPNEIIFFAVPDFSSGLTLAESLSLSDFSLPSEIYAARAYKSLHENRNAPYSGIWYVPGDTDDETFSAFVATVSQRYTGSKNFGRNPIVMRGEGGFKPISSTENEAPYAEGRDINRREVSAISGVPGAKYGADAPSQNAVREIRREFYESTLQPVTGLLEDIIYLRVCVGLFDAPEWRFKFGRPDFTTAVEDASIELRRIQWGQWSPNEARASRGEPPREGGDYYLTPMNMVVDGKPGRPENEPIDDGEGDMAPIEEDPVPGTDKPVPVGGLEEIMSELRVWRRFARRVFAGRRIDRQFMPDKIPQELYEAIASELDIAETDDDICVTFDSVISEIESIIGG